MTPTPTPTSTPLAQQVHDLRGDLMFVAMLLIALVVVCVFIATLGHRHNANGSVR